MKTIAMGRSFEKTSAKVCTSSSATSGVYTHEERSGTFSCGGILFPAVIGSEIQFLTPAESVRLGFRSYSACQKISVERGEQIMILEEVWEQVNNGKAFAKRWTPLRMYSRATEILKERSLIAFIDGDAFIEIHQVGVEVPAWKKLNLPPVSQKYPEGYIFRGTVEEFFEVCPRKLYNRGVDRLNAGRLGVEIFSETVLERETLDAIGQLLSLAQYIVREPLPTKVQEVA